MKRIVLSWRDVGWWCAMALAAVVAVQGCGEGNRTPDIRDSADGPMIFDFAKRLPSAQVLEECTTLDLGNPAADLQLGAGWGNNESRSDDGTTFVWATSRRVGLDVIVFDTRPTRLWIRAWPFSWDGGPDQTVDVFVNGHEIGSATMKRRPRDYSFRIPRNTLVVGVNRVEFEFGFAEEVRARKPESDDRRTLAVAFDAVGVGARLDAGRTECGSRPAPAADGQNLVLAPATGAAFRLNHVGETVLSFGLEANGAPPPPDSRVVVWTRRAGQSPVGLLEGKIDRVLGRQWVRRIPSGEGMFEVGMAVTGGTEDSEGGDWELVITRPMLQGAEQSREKISNVLLVIVDTLRADHLGAYGSQLATPNIDRLAASGVTFRRAYSHIPITGPSHSTLFTSLIPPETGVHNNGQVLGSTMPTMAEILKNDGRNTGGVVSLGVLKSRFGLARGFDTYLDSFDNDWMKNAAEVNEEVLNLLDGSLPEPYFLWIHYSDPHEPYAPPDLDYPRIVLELDGEAVGEVTAGGRGHQFEIVLSPGTNHLRFVDADASEPRKFRLTSFDVRDRDVEVRPGEGWRTRERFSAKDVYESTFPATMLLRSPGNRPRPVKIEVAFKLVLPQKELRRLYNLEVEYVDREIGRLLDEMERRRLLDNTLIVFASDHGEGLGDHNHFGHISQLYDSLLRVPLIMSYPGRLPAGVTVDQPVGLVDVLPTVLDLLDHEPLSHANGASLLPLVFGEAGEWHPLFSATYRPEAPTEKRGLVKDGFKYIHCWDDDRDWEELYDLSADPGEVNELSASDAGRVAVLREELQRRLAVATSVDVIEAELSKQEIERLRALGYIH